MRFIKDTLSFISQVLLIIFVNLFVADLTFSILIMTLYYYVNDNCDICGILSAMLFILKFISLPILYKVLYKKSKNKIILGFIHLLKTNILFKIFILFLTLIPENLLFNKKFKLFEILLYIYVSLFGSYLFLFLWWEVEKWWKNDCDKWYGSKRIKNTKIYLEINKIFNKIQDFNYQNFQKCQKIVFVILTPIYKFLEKIKKVLDKKVF